MNSFHKNHICVSRYVRTCPDSGIHISAHRHASTHERSHTSILPRCTTLVWPRTPGMKRSRHESWQRRQNTRRNKEQPDKQSNKEKPKGNRMNVEKKMRMMIRMFVCCIRESYREKNIPIELRMAISRLNKMKWYRKTKIKSSLFIHIATVLKKRVLSLLFGCKMLIPPLYIWSWHNLTATQMITWDQTYHCLIM